MVTVEVLRVFTDDNGAHGNPLGVVLHGATVPDEQQRQKLAADLAFSETIFIDDIEHSRLQIFTPTVELPFAGHPAVGAAWLLSRERGSVVTVLNTRAGPVPTWRRDEQVWVRGSLGSTPPWWHERLPTAGAVTQLRGPLNPNQDATQLWAWQDQAAGINPRPGIRSTLWLRRRRSLRISLHASSGRTRPTDHRSSRRGLHHPRAAGTTRNRRNRWTCGQRRHNRSLNNTTEEYARIKYGGLAEYYSVCIARQQF